MKNQDGIAIRFVQEWDEIPDEAHEKAWALVLQDKRDVPIGRKYADARRFLAEREAAK